MGDSEQSDSSESSNPGRQYITRDFCDERFNRILDGNKNLVVKISEVKDLVKSLTTEIKEEKKEEKHFWRNLLGTVLGGGVVAIIAWILSTVLH